jgi:hypothetical protein
MRYSKMLVWCALAMAIPGASVLSAAGWNGRDYARVDRVRDDRVGVDRGRDGRMQDDIARDRARLNEDIRCGRSDQAAADARDLARDERGFNAPDRGMERTRRDWR